MFISAPHRVREIVLCADDTHSLKRVVGESMDCKERIAFAQVFSPELNVDVLALIAACQLLCRYGDRLSVKVISKWNTREVEQRRNDISMTGWDILDRTFLNSWATDEKWDVYVFFNSTAFARGQAMLTDVEAVVGSVNEIGIC